MVSNGGRERRPDHAVAEAGRAGEAGAGGAGRVRGPAVREDVSHTPGQQVPQAGPYIPGGSRRCVVIKCHYTIYQIIVINRNYKITRLFS